MSGRADRGRKPVIFFLAVLLPASLRATDSQDPIHLQTTRQAIQWQDKKLELEEALGAHQAADRSHARQGQVEGFGGLIAGRP